MKWYSKYLQVYEQPFASAPPEVVGFVKKKLRKLSENKQPLASVVLICHNEETRLLSCLWSLCDNECDFPIEILLAINVFLVYSHILYFIVKAGRMNRGVTSKLFDI